MARSRSSCSPMLMKWVAVSARGKRRTGSLAPPPFSRSRRKCPVRHISSALMHTSPSPCTPWPSPAEKRAPGLNTGQIQRRALADLLVVEVAAMRARLLGGDRAPLLRRRHAHHAEEGRERQGDARPDRHRAGARRAVHRDVQQAAVGEVLRQGADEGAEAAEAPIGAELDLLHRHPEAVARLGAAHRHRPGDDVRPEPRHVAAVDGEQPLRDREGAAGRRASAPVRRTRTPAPPGRPDRPWRPAGSSRRKRPSGRSPAWVRRVCGGARRAWQAPRQKGTGKAGRREGSIRYRAAPPFAPVSPGAPPGTRGRGVGTPRAGRSRGAARRAPPAWRPWRARWRRVGRPATPPSPTAPRRRARPPTPPSSAPPPPAPRRRGAGWRGSPRRGAARAPPFRGTGIPRAAARGRCGRCARRGAG